MRYVRHCVTRVERNGEALREKGGETELERERSRERERERGGRERGGEI